MPLRKISAEAFARRLKETSSESDKRYALFLGAGCSVSSGIPTAGSLVRDEWLPRLHRFDDPHREFDEWAAEAFPEYEAAASSEFYGPVMEQLFLTSEDRQREVERLCEGRFPGFGYAALASLMTLPGGAFNVVLTTNFDDLIADALYLFTRARPLVIHHESLAGFIRSTRTRPLVVKVHGDNRLAPRNTIKETATLKRHVQRQIASLLHDRGLIFIGYSGNDRGIADMLAGLHESALPLGVYWVNGEEPSGALRDWLDAKNSVWIEKADFDEFMLLVRDQFDLPHPEQRRFEEVFEKYKSTYAELSSRIVSRPSSEPGASALKEAVRRTDRSFPSWNAVELEAYRLADDPQAADEVYQRGLADFPASVPLLNNYANFLTDVLAQHDRAEELYRKALEAAPHSPRVLANYAAFLQSVRRDSVRAEEYYREALKADPDDANILGNYAGFLLGRGRTQEGLERLEAVMTSDRAADDLRLELSFYRLSHDPHDGRIETIRNLKRQLARGVRSPRWDFSLNLEQAEKEGNPDLEWLRILSDVITNDAEVNLLDEWEVWANA